MIAQAARLVIVTLGVATASLAGCGGGGGDARPEPDRWVKIQSPADGHQTWAAELRIEVIGTLPGSAARWTMDRGQSGPMNNVVGNLFCGSVFQCMDATVPLSMGANPLTIRRDDGATAMISVTRYPAVAITGQVVDSATGMPISGVTVVKTSVTPGGTSTTTARSTMDGYVFGPERDGRHAFRAELRDLQDPGCYALSAASVEVVIGPLEPVSRMTGPTFVAERLKPCFAVRGVVLRNSGTQPGVENVEVVLTDAGGATWTKRSGTDGRFEFPILAPGAYSVSAKPYQGWPGVAYPTLPAGAVATIGTADVTLAPFVVQFPP